MPRPFSRRQFLGQCVGGLAAAGCSSSSPSKSGPYAGQTLRVFIYSGGLEKTLRAAFVDRLEARTGATVVLDPGWWDSIPKLKASPPGQPAFDLVLTDATQGYPAIKEGLFQKIDMKRIPNRERLSPAVLDNWVYREGYGITFPDSVMTLAYHKELLPFTPTSWADLLRDDVKGKVALYNSFYMSLYTFACMKAAQEGKAGTAHAEVEENLPGVLDFAKAQRDRVRYWWPTSTDMSLSLAQKDCAIGNQHSTQMLRTLVERSELGAVVPEQDRAFTQLMWVIPAGTRHKELAEEAINELFSPEVQREFCRNGCMTSQVEVAAEIAAADPLWKQFYPSTEEQLRSLRYYPYDAYFRAWDEIVKTWDQEILRKG
ncbi:MAG: PotD/PotF family extracellular solute-binding protein [Gemmataceae bacterium]